MPRPVIGCRWRRFAAARPDPKMLSAMERDRHLTAEGAVQRLGREEAAPMASTSGPTAPEGQRSTLRYRVVADVTALCAIRRWQRPEYLTTSASGAREPDEGGGGCKRGGRR